MNCRSSQKMKIGLILLNIQIYYKLSFSFQVFCPLSVRIMPNSKFTFYTRLDSSPNAKHGAAASGASCSREHMEFSVEVPQVVAGKQQLGQVKVQPQTYYYHVPTKRRLAVLTEIHTPNT